MIHLRLKPKTPKFMKIAIVGAGIVGVTTAYELASDGHEVSVFEQRSAAAEEASFATAGLLAPHLPQRVDVGSGCPGLRKGVEGVG